MFTAYDENGNKVSISRAEKGKSYFCPICHEQLSVKKGKIKILHFSHKPDSSCVEDWGDMSEWHLAWQEKFPEECREIVLEKGDEVHRADVCIEEKKLVIEFQHSPISCEDFNRRNQFYTDCGYRLVWVFDAAKKIKEDRICHFCGAVNNFSGLQKMYPNVSRFKDKLEWRRKQSAFEGFGERWRGRPIDIFLETPVGGCEDKILLPLIDINEKSMEALVAPRYIRAENFLKEYGGFAGENVSSISSILGISEQKGPKTETAVRQQTKPRWSTVGRRGLR